MQKKIPSYPAVGINIFTPPCQRCRNNHLAARCECRLSTHGCHSRSWLRRACHRVPSRHPFLSARPSRGFIGPLGVRLVLDWVDGAQGWGVAFGHLALITLTGLFFLRRLGARSALQTLAATSG